jgi:hypothetical protein
MIAQPLTNGELDHLYDMPHTLYLLPARTKTAIDAEAAWDEQSPAAKYKATMRTVKERLATVKGLPPIWNVFEEDVTNGVVAVSFERIVTGPVAHRIRKAGLEITDFSISRYVICVKVLPLPLPTKALDPAPTMVLPTAGSKPLPLDEKPCVAPVATLPSRMHATGMWQDKRGWHVPVFGDPRMWDLLLPKLQELDAYAGHVAVPLRWDVYLNAIQGSFTEAASQIRELVYSFDPFKDVVIDYEGGMDDSTMREYRDNDGNTYKE